MDNRQTDDPPRVAYFFTRFPHLTETFLQREVSAMIRLGLRPAIHSFHGGGPSEFEGVPIRRFSKWSLLALFWRGPLECLRRPAVAAEFVRALFTTWPRDWLNHWENLYGAGIAAILAPRFRRERIDHIHAAWASLPAMTAWVLARLIDVPFSVGAHAYDLFEHDGDWFLREKCLAAAFVHTSTAAGRDRLLALGVPAERIACVRRGLDRMPPCRPLRSGRVPVRIVCIARLVEKKGLLRQLGIYAALRAAGLPFRVRVLGDGPMRPRLEAEIRGRRLSDEVELLGQVDHARIWAELAEADVLVHTGIVSPSGDRDGLPNVVPEAMAAGVIVVTAPADGVLEAIEDGATGLVCDLDAPAAWLRAFERVVRDDVLADRLRSHARAWVEANFDAGKNAAILLERFRIAVAAGVSSGSSRAVVPETPCSTST
jgi:colanic acid/amylovoran biosynthesis glycosyltransferase